MDKEREYSSDDFLNLLTPREIDVIELVAMGVPPGIELANAMRRNYNSLRGGELFNLREKGVYIQRYSVKIEGRLDAYAMNLLLPQAEQMSMRAFARACGISVMTLSDNIKGAGGMVGLSNRGQCLAGRSRQEG